MTFGNYCNLACRTCHSDLSHSWIEDEEELVKRGLMGKVGNKRINIEKEWLSLIHI